MVNIRQLFAESPKGFRPVPWWSWTGHVAKEQIDRDLLIMRSQGIFEFIIFAISGIAVEFNSNAYLDKVGYVLRRCRELGMRCWIYDDYNWPTGTCAGKVLRDHPWTQSRVLVYKVERVGAEKEIQIGIPGQFVRAFFLSEDGAARPLADQPTPTPDGTLVLRWYTDTAQPGRVIAFSLDQLSFVMPFGAGSTWTWNQPGVLDGLNPDAVKVFIDYSYEPYAERFSEYMGKELVGFFSDEPSMWGFRRYGPNTLPYTKGLWSIFEEQYGYSLRERVLELVAETGSWQRTRWDYWKLCSDLFAENFVSQLNDWCVRHGLEFTGHFMGEETVRWNVRFSGDVHRAARRMTVPGTDLLGDLASYDVDAPGRASVVLYDSLRSLNVTVKRIANTADYTYAERRLVESLGAAGSDHSLARMKKMVDWLTGMGLNLINGLGGGFTTPWFRYFGQFSEHVGRVCWMTTLGHSVEEVGVLYPSTSGWMLYGGMFPGSTEARAWPMIEAAVVETCDALNRVHRGYKLLFDEQVADAQVRGTELMVGEFLFRTVILPGVAALTRAVAAKLAEFAEQGGSILIVGGRPFLTPDPEWNVVDAMDLLLEHQQVQYLSDPVWGDAYESWLAERIERPAIAVEGDGTRQVLSSWRQDELHDYLFLSNQTEQPAQIRVFSELEGMWELWDPDTGGQWQILTNREGKLSTWIMELAPLESAFVVLSRDGGVMQEKTGPCLKSRAVAERTLLSGPWEFERLVPNMVVLSLSIRPDPKDEGMGAGWQYGRERTWIPITGGRTEIDLDPDEMAWFWIRAEIELAHLPPDLELVLDSPDYGEVFVNGLSLTRGREATMWSDGNYVLPLSEFVFRGRNIVVLRCRPPWIYSKRVRGNFIQPHNVRPVVIRGSFSVFQDENGCPVVVPERGEIQTGPWETQGYPDFCGSAVYRKRITLPQLGGQYCLALEQVRHVAEVVVNGHNLGARLWQPYAFDVTEALQAGENDLAIQVTNSFGRLFPSRSQFEAASHKVVSGLLGRVWLVRTIE